MGLGHGIEAQPDVLAGLALVAVAAGVWVLELRRRAGRAASSPADEYMGTAARESLLGASVLDGPVQLCKSLAPEACGVVLCLAVAGALLSLGASDPAPGAEEDKEVWDQIRSQWPTLVTADSLLALRAMLRILLVFSAVLRTDEALASPLAGEPGFLLFLAAVSRVALLALSPLDVYHLDGPLGGITAVLLEVASVGPLAFLAFGKYIDTSSSISRPCLAAVAAAVVLAVRAAWTNHLALGGPEEAYLDVLFSLGEALELAAAAAFLVRVLCSAGREGSRSAFAAFAHVLLPAQQLLSAYFMLTAWGGAPLEEVPALVGAGRPFELLQLGGAAQVGSYVVAGTAQLVFASALEKEAAARPVQV